MTEPTHFTSSLTAETRDVFDCVVDLGLRVWPPTGVHSTVDDGFIHLFYLLDGILGCEPMPYLTQVLPREVLRVGASGEVTLENPSRSDTTEAVQITLRPADDTPVSIRHHYFSDDQKDNKLCRVAARERDGPTLETRSPVDVYLTTLGKYDTVLLDRHENQPLLVMCPRGSATVNMVPVSVAEPAVSVDSDTATVTGISPCTVLIIRGQATT